jgi:hypothetical protein
MEEEVAYVDRVDVVEGVTVPGSVRRRSRRKSGATMGRQDSTVPILKEG